MKNPWSWVPSLYSAEGLPYVIVMQVAVLMYKQFDLSNTEIALYTSMFYLPWTIKPLWSPFIDMYKTKRWWIITMQALIGAAFAGIAFTIPTDFWLQATIAFFWLLAFSSATHDVAADGFYMLGLNEGQQSMFVGIRSTFYRLASLFGSGVLIMIAGNLQTMLKGSVKYSWSLIFYGLTGIFIALMLWHTRALPKPNTDKGLTGNITFSDVLKELWETIKTFFTKMPLKEVILATCFMLLYRMPEGLLVKITPLFLIEQQSAGGLGLSPQEIGFVQGTVGVIGLTLGGIIGGVLVSRDGLKKWLWPMVFAITIPDAVYIYLSMALPDNFLLINACIAIEQFGYGFGFTAYMMYLIYYSRGEHKTSHYALCTAFMALSMMIPGLFSGWLQENVGYQNFFIIVMILCAITFLVSALVKIDPEFGKENKSDKN
ncbi:MAG: MFS transporter [Bacteroidaceae bacterium]|nr:MFS transporter [Bacteroidaceae bacterium]